MLVVSSRREVYSLFTAVHGFLFSFVEIFGKGQSFGLMTLHITNDIHTYTKFMKHEWHIHSTKFHLMNA